MNFHQIIQGDCLKRLREMPSESVHCVVTSPPYYALRNYQVDGQIGLEETPQEYIAKMVEVFEEVRRVLRSDGALFLNLGDSYANDAKWGGSTGGKHVKDLHGDTAIGRQKRVTGFKPKDLMLIPARVAIALQDDGWYVRSALSWFKRNPMPESCRDRPAKATEEIYMLTKAPRYYFDMEAVRVVSNWDASNTTFPAGWATGNDHSTVGWNTAKRRGDPKKKNRDRSLPTNHNGITGSLDETPAGRRNFRNSDLWYSSIKEPHGLVGIGDELVGLDVNPAGFSEAHFATYPPKLIEPLIKASTSEKGVCGECCAPYERVVEPSEEYAKKLGTWTPDTDADAGLRMEIGFAANGKKEACVADYKTTGWQKTCDCETDEIVPATVLDPFCGAATTLLVAKRLGRRSIGIELNPEYIEIAERRLEYWHKPSPPKVAETNEDLPLFGSDL